MIHVGFISSLGRIRSADPAQVAALAESIKEVGLLNPITVCAAKIIRNGQEVDGYSLIAGLHRLEACKRLGWQEVPAVIVDLGEQQRIIAECDENLCSSKLTPSEVALFTAKRKAAYETLHPETVNGAVGNGREKVRQLGEATPRFTADTAAKTGKSERNIQREAERGEKVSLAAMAMIKGTSLDTGRYLDSIKGLSPEQQVAKIKRDIDAGRPTPKPPIHAPDPEDDYAVTERHVAALMNAWNKAGKEAREQFLDRIGAAQ